MNDVTLALESNFDRDHFWEGGRSVRYLVTRITAKNGDEGPGGARPPLNIALAIDASGSMFGGKLEAAKRAAIGLLERLGEGDRLTLVSFASEVITHLDTVEIRPERMHEIRSEITKIQTRGTTHLSGGWFRAVDRAARIYEIDNRMTPRVILLSDGHANQGITDTIELSRHARELAARGVITSALGIGDGYDEQLLRSIAENGGGRLHDAEFESEISSVLLGELDDIFATVAEQSRLEIRYPREFEVEILGSSEKRGHNGFLVADIGALQNGVDRVVVSKVTCPRSHAGKSFAFQTVVSAKDTLNGELISTEPVSVETVAADSNQNAESERDDNLAILVMQQWQASVLARAACLNRDRAFREVEAYVRRELSYFETYASNLAEGQRMTQELRTLLNRVDRDLSPRMHKEMVLSSELAFSRRVDHRGAEKHSWAERLAEEI